MIEMIERPLDGLAKLVREGFPWLRRGGVLSASHLKPSAQRAMVRYLREKFGDEVAMAAGGIPGAGAAGLRILPESFFLSADFDSFATEFRGLGIKEIHRHSLYSYKVYPAAGQVELLLFDQNIGLATNGLGDTNMQVPGQMSGNEAMVILNVRVVPLPARADYDTVAAGTPVAWGEWFEVLNRNSWLVMEISDKPYLTIGPLSMFPAGIGPGTTVVSLATVTRNIAFSSNGEASNRSLWVQDPPLTVLPNRTLRLFLRWRAAIAVTTGSPGKIGSVLDGYRIRSVQ
jgi:hypothetical protein